MKTTHTIEYPGKWNVGTDPSSVRLAPYILDKIMVRAKTVDNTVYAPSGNDNCHSYYRSKDNGSSSPGRTSERYRVGNSECYPRGANPTTRLTTKSNPDTNYWAIRKNIVSYSVSNIRTNSGDTPSGNSIVDNGANKPTVSVDLPPTKAG